MAKTHKQALIDAVESIGTTKRIKYRDTIHLPVHQVSVGETRIAIYMDDEEFASEVAKRERLRLKDGVVDVGCLVCGTSDAAGSQATAGGGQ